jgi:hypothetical protein
MFVGLQAKRKVLLDTMNKINAKHGAGTVMPMKGEAVNV